MTSVDMLLKRFESPDYLFYIPPTPHDCWVVGDSPYVSLRFAGADHYASGESRGWQ